RISCTCRMSTPYSSSPSTKVRNSPLPTPAAASGVVGASWTVWSDADMGWSLGWGACVGGSGGRRHRRRLGEPARVDDQRHAAVAEDGGAGHAGDALVVGLEVLDHDLLLAEQLVDLQRQTPAVGLDHHRDARRRVLAALGRLQPV